MSTTEACERLFTLMDNTPAGWINPHAETYDRMLAQYADAIRVLEDASDERVD